MASERLARWNIDTCSSTNTASRAISSRDSPGACFVTDAVIWRDASW
jgi:hypothetical protein